MFIIEWTDRAMRQIEKILDSRIRQQIYACVDTLKEFPKCKNIKMLKNHQYDYRLRIGRYRVLFNVTTTIKIVYIEEVVKRDDQTY